MNSLTKNLLITCLLFLFSGIDIYNANCQQTGYYQADSAISAKFDGEPVKTFCQSALGDITSLKYDSRNNSETNIFICEISIYKNIKSVSPDNEDIDYLKYIVSSEEMSILEQNGKILEKKDSTFLSHPGLLCRVYLSEKKKDEKIKGWINKNLYFRHNNSVVKLATYIPEKEDDNITNTFFSLVRINQ
jgi:hypothetical protein